MAHSEDRVINDLRAKVRELRPIIEANVEANERERRLVPAIFEALRDARLFQLAIPKALGGFELDPVSTYKVIEELARIDGATGWCVAIAQSWGSIGLGTLGEKALGEIFPDRGAIAAGAFNPPGALIPVEGGFRFSNRGAFASGCQHAKVQLMTGMVMNGDQPLVDAAGAPDVRLVMMPTADVIIHDTWDTMGMRGTGSHDIEARDVFVPEHHTGQMGAVGSAAYANPMYKIFMMAVHFETVVSIGVAQAAVDYVLKLAPGKTPAMTANSLRDRATAQAQVAEAQAIVNAARATLYSSITEGLDEATRTGAVSLPTKLTMQLAACFAADQCARAVQLVWSAAGTSGIKTGSPLHRYFRDINTLSQHASKSLPRYESVGRIMFGVESDWPIFAL